MLWIRHTTVILQKEVSLEGFLFLFFISKLTLSIEHNFTEEMEDNEIL